MVAFLGSLRIFSSIGSRTFLLRLGLIGPEYKNVREHLLSNLPGDRAWRYDKAQYASLQERRNHERQR